MREYKARGDIPANACKSLSLRNDAAHEKSTHDQ